MKDRHVILEARVSLLMEWCVVLKLETNIVTVIETRPMDALRRVEADRASDSCNSTHSHREATFHPKEHAQGERFQ